MKLLREYIHLASQNEILRDRRYITEVLGIQIPLHESYPFSVGLEARILHEHMLLEGFFDGLKNLKDDALLFGKSLKEIISSPDRIGAFVGSLHKSVIKRMLKPIKNFFKMIMEKFPKFMKEKFPTLVKTAESILAGIDKVVDKIVGMSGWKQAIGTMALALGMKYIWNKVGELIEKGKEKLEELIPMFDVIEAAGLKEDEGSGSKLEKAKEAVKSFAEWFRDKIVGQVVDFVKEKLKELATSVVGSAVAGGVKGAWDTLTKLYGGAKFVMGTLAPAFRRFGRSSKQDGKIAKEGLLREYIREILTEESTSVSLHRGSNDDYFRVNLSVDGRMVGYAEVNSTRRYSNCQENVAELEQFPEYIAAKEQHEATSKWSWSPKMYVTNNVWIPNEADRGKGYGRLIYQAAIDQAIQYAGTSGGVFIGSDACDSAGSTSSDAGRVWSSLGQQFGANSGQLIFVRTN